MAWKKVDDEILKSLKKQKAFEDDVAKKLTPLYKSAENPFVKLFLHTIVLDTKRHADTYKMLIDLNERVLIGEASKETMSQELMIHIKEESKMLDQAKKISQSVRDEKYKQIIDQILEDEIRHHRILQELSVILKKEASEWNRYFYDMFTGFP